MLSYSYAICIKKEQKEWEGKFVLLFKRTFKLIKNAWKLLRKSYT